MINSNNTQRNSDHDFTKLRKRALGNQGGVESKEQFIFDNDTKKLSAGSDIATAYILCTRPASNPIPNQKFLAQFEFTGSLDFLNITNGDKIFIEIKEKLVKDPTLIEDLDSQTNYNQGLGIGEIKIAKNYPSHINYLKLYEWNDGQLVDLRKAISLPALDSVSQRTTTLEEKVSQAEEKVEKLEEAGTPSNLAVYWIVGCEYSEWDSMYKVKIPREEYSRNGKECIFWVHWGKEVEVTYLLNGISFQSIGLFLGRVGSPMDWVTVEIRNAIPSGNSVATYKAGDILYATWSILPTEIDESLKKIEVSLNNLIALEKGQKIVLKIKRTGTNYDTANFYYLGYVNLENNNKKVGLLEIIRIWANNDPTRMNMMIPITCPGVEQELFLNKNTNYQLQNILKQAFTFNNAWDEEERTLNIPASWRYKIKIRATGVSTFSFYLKQNNKKIKDLPRHSYNSSWVEYDWGEVDLEKWECKIVGRITQSNNSMSCEISLISDFTEEKMRYLADSISNIWATEKFIFFGKYKNSWKSMDQDEYPRGMVVDISATNSAETKSMYIPHPWVVILSAWTDYKRVSCDIDGITFIELYQQNSGSISQTLTIPVKGGEKVTVKKHEYSWGASAKFISL